MGLWALTAVLQMLCAALTAYGCARVPARDCGIRRHVLTATMLPMISESRKQRSARRNDLGEPQPATHDVVLPELAGEGRRIGKAVGTGVRLMGLEMQRQDAAAG